MIVRVDRTKCIMAYQHREGRAARRSSSCGCRKDKRVKGEGADTYKPGGLIATTVGRVLFNDILPAEHGVLQHDDEEQGPGERHFRLLPRAGPSRRRSSCSTR